MQHFQIYLQPGWRHRKKKSEAIPIETDDENVAWAKLLASKIRKLDDIRQEEFKFKVDGLILEEIKAQAAMPNI